MEATHPNTQVDPENPSKMEDGGEAWQDEQDEQEKAWSAKWETGTKDWGERAAQAMEDVPPRLHEQAGAERAADLALKRQFKKKEKKKMEDSIAFAKGVAELRELKGERRAAKGGPSRRRKAAGEGLARLTAPEESQPVPEQLLDPQTETSETPSYNVRLISEGLVRDSRADAQIFLNENQLVVQSEGEQVATMNYSDIASFGPRKSDPDKKNPSTMRIDSIGGSKIKIEFYSHGWVDNDFSFFRRDLKRKVGEALKSMEPAALEMRARQYGVSVRTIKQKKMRRVDNNTGDDMKEEGHLLLFRKKNTIIHDILKKMEHNGMEGGSSDGGKKSKRKNKKYTKRRKSKRKNKKYTKRRKTTKRKYTKRRKSKTRRRRR